MCNFLQGGKNYTCYLKLKLCDKLYDNEIFDRKHTLHWQMGKPEASGNVSNS